MSETIKYGDEVILFNEKKWTGLALTVPTSQDPGFLVYLTRYKEIIDASSSAVKKTGKNCTGRINATIKDMLTKIQCYALNHNPKEIGVGAHIMDWIDENNYEGYKQGKLFEIPVRVMYDLPFTITCIYEDATVDLEKCLAERE